MSTTAPIMSLQQWMMIATIHSCRGVLLCGPPGTGKTLAARAVAGACAQASPKPVAFFARNGADCLGKWAGDAERNLRLLFDEVWLAQVRQAHPEADICDPESGTLLGGRIASHRFGRRWYSSRLNARPRLHMRLG